MNGPDVKISNNPEDSHLVPAHSSGENMLMQESSHGSNFSNAYLNIWSIEKDQITVKIIMRNTIVVIRFDSSERCD